MNHAPAEPAQPVRGTEAGRVDQLAGGHEAADFVRFCYRRRRVSWPALYDDMCAVAARGEYRGLGYSELAERGISFCLGELPALAALAEVVIADERERERQQPERHLHHI